MKQFQVVKQYRPRDGRGSPFTNQSGNRFRSPPNLLGPGDRTVLPGSPDPGLPAKALATAGPASARPATTKPEQVYCGRGAPSRAGVFRRRRLPARAGTLGAPPSLKRSLPSESPSQSHVLFHVTIET